MLAPLGRFSQAAEAERLAPSTPIAPTSGEM
jgi:hypothetical protein